ncbi:MAG: putative sulfate exporter family transporter [Rhodomicrobium sp.]
MRLYWLAKKPLIARSRLFASLLPGLLLCIIITLLAGLLEMLERGLTGEAYLEALVIAILIGVVIRTFWEPGVRWQAGIQFSAKTLLEIAIMLLGAAVSLGTVLALGPLLLLGIGVLVIAGIITSYGISRAFGLPKCLAILVACGNSICGNSAIVAVAPVIGAEARDVAASIAFTAVLGVAVVLGLPLLVPVLDLSLTQYGVLAGLTVYAVPQVLAATLPIGALSNQIGTVVKLVRVLMLGPVVLAMSLLADRLHDKPTDGGAISSKLPRPPLSQLVPWFILAFLVLMGIRSMGLIPEPALFPIKTAASVLTTIAMGALGLGVNIRAVAKAGLPVTAAVTLSLLVLGLISLGLIHLLKIA